MKSAFSFILFVLVATCAHSTTIPITPDVSEAAKASARVFLRENPNRRLGCVTNTKSMVPTLDTECIVVLEPVPFEQLKRSQIVTFNVDWAPTTVVHRLLKQTGAGWLTKGDRLSVPDPTLLTKETYAGEIIVAAIHKRTGRVQTNL